MLHLNGWFGEIRCTTKRSLPHVRRNAAPAKAKNQTAVLSAYRTSNYPKCCAPSPMSGSGKLRRSIESVHERQLWAEFARSIFVPLSYLTLALFGHLRCALRERPVLHFGSSPLLPLAQSHNAAFSCCCHFTLPAHEGLCFCYRTIGRSDSRVV